MKIEGLENIRDIFNIFHDGDIVGCHRDLDALFLEVEIHYLAARIDPSFQTFVIRLFGVENVHFTTWPNPQFESKIFTDIRIFFKPKLCILEADIEEEQIQVVCSQQSGEFDYHGGTLFLTAVNAEVIDEAGISYSVDELNTICAAYWDEWANTPEMAGPPRNSSGEAS